MLDVIRDYRRDDFGYDFVAGLVVGVVTIPQAIAYAFLAGLPAQAGLYACLLPTLIYALLGSSRHLVIGPVAVAALMVAAAVAEQAPATNEAAVGIAVILSLQAGLFLLLLRALQMGGVVNLLSHPVISGFINAAAILIVVSQLPALLGLPDVDGHDTMQRLWLIATNLPASNPTVVIIGALSLATLIFVQRGLLPSLRRLMHLRRGFAARLRRWGVSFKAPSPLNRIGPMVVAVGATGAVWLWGLRDAVPTVGAVPAGLPGFVLPPFQPALWLELAPAAALIALVAYVESYSVGTAIASRERQRVNPHQELIALGAANIGAAFTGAYPVAGSFSRSSVNYGAGARTPMSSMVAMALVVSALLFFTPVFAYLPNAALAAVVIASVLTLFDWRSPRDYWRFYPQDALTHGATLLSVLAFGVETGLLIGVVVSILLFVRRSSKPHIAVVGRVAETTHFRNVERYDVVTDPTVASVRVDENLFFANARTIENKLMKVVVREPETRHLVLVCSAINMIDASGLEMLVRINDSFRALGVKLHLSDVKGPVMAQLEAGGFPRELSGTIFFTADQAERDLAARRPRSTEPQGTAKREAL